MTRRSAKLRFPNDKYAHDIIDQIFDELDHDLQGMCLVENCMVKTTEEDRLQEKYVEGWNQAIEKLRKLFKKR